MPAVNNVNPWSGPSIGRARPASPTRYSSSSPPSRSATASIASTTACSAGSPRTSAAAASVTARQAVWHRPSQWVSRDNAGASSNRRPGSPARATPSGAQYITDPFPALTSGPRRSKTASAPSRSAKDVWFPTSGGPVASQATCRASTSDRSSAPSCSTSDLHRFRAIAVSSVQVPGGIPIHGSSNAGNGSGISERRRNSNGAPRASPTARPRMLPIARSRWSVTAGAYPQVTPTRGLVA